MEHEYWWQMVRIVFHVNQYTHRHTISRVSLAPPTQPHTRDEMTSSTYEMLQLPISTTASVGQLIGLVTLVHLNQQECYNYSFFYQKQQPLGRAFSTLSWTSSHRTILAQQQGQYTVFTQSYFPISVYLVCVCVSCSNTNTTIGE